MISRKSFDKYFNVAENAVVIQSSISKWSRLNQINQFVKGGECKDFTVHTDFEKDPWVKIELEEICYPDFIVVENRKRIPFDEIAYTLKVECSCDDQRYQVLHCGYLAFGTFDGDCPPIILSLKKTKEVKFIRLSLSNGDPIPLHLSKLYVLNEKPTDLSHDIAFLSDRSDGLGERLKSLLNAVVLSYIYGTNYYFTWKPISNSVRKFHSIEMVEEVFSESFINEHFVDSAKSFRDILPIENFSKTDSIPRCIRVNQNPIDRYMPSLKNKITSKDYVSAFRAISFSEKVSFAINVANGVELGENVLAIHVRSGDIVHGRYRHGDRYTKKVIPLYALDLLITKNLDAYDQIVLFGQDESVCDYFSRNFNCVVSSKNLTPDENFSTLQRAMFDIALMSRCSQIISGTSGFSQLSATISGQKNIDPLEYLNNHYDHSSIVVKAFSFLTDNSEVFSPLDIAFSYWHLYYNFVDRENLELSERCVGQAVVKDPDNYFYKVVYALILSNASFYERSLEYFSIIVDSSREEFGLNYLVTSKYPDGRSVLHNYRRDLESIVRKKVVPTNSLAYFILEKIDAKC